MHVAIIDYGSGNLHSAAKAFERAAREGVEARRRGHRRPDDVADADRIVLPGVGAFADCSAASPPSRHERGAGGGRAGARQPFLGICVGMQLMAERGLEQA